MGIEKRVKKVFNLIFRDKSGRVVIWQFPNIPIVGWFIFTLASRMMSSGELKSSFAQLSNAFLFTWAYLELFQGVNYFRRLLGLVLIGALVISFF